MKPSTEVKKMSALKKAVKINKANELKDRQK